MNMQFIQERIKEMAKDVPDFKLDITYAIIYPTIDTIKFCNRSEMIAELGLLKDCDVAHMEIIWVNKNMTAESALHIAKRFNLGFQVMYDIISNDMTPYQALQKWDII